jgi:excinuclease UvrABC nuclease subunit
METKEILEQLKRKMQRCAKELQFEQAAILRDEIEKIEVTIK